MKTPERFLILVPIFSIAWCEVHQQIEAVEIAITPITIENWRN